MEGACEHVNKDHFFFFFFTSLPPQSSFMRQVNMQVLLKVAPKANNTQ